MTIENYSIQGAKDLVSNISSSILFVNSGSCTELKEVQDKVLMNVQDKLEQLETHLMILDSPEYAEAVAKKAPDTNIKAIAS